MLPQERRGHHNVLITCSRSSYHIRPTFSIHLCHSSNLSITSLAFKLHPFGAHTIFFVRAIRKAFFWTVQNEPSGLASSEVCLHLYHVVEMYWYIHMLSSTFLKRSFKFPSSCYKRHAGTSRCDRGFSRFDFRCYIKPLYDDEHPLVDRLKVKTALNAQCQCRNRLSM